MPTLRSVSPTVLFKYQKQTLSLSGEHLSPSVITSIVFNSSIKTSFAVISSTELQVEVPTFSIDQK